jgi:hypothetical protein
MTALEDLQSVDSPNSDVVQIPDSLTTASVEPELEDSDESDVCSGLDNSAYDEPAIKKWLRGEKFSEKAMRPPIEYRSEGDEFFPSLVDVNGDNKNELMVKSYCSPLKNCYFSIYEKSGKGFHELFLTNNTGQAVNLLKSTHKGYRDIEITTKINGSTGFVSRYFFNDYAYDPEECFAYHTTGTGDRAITPIDCYEVEDDRK